MGGITHTIGDLFTAPRGAILVHACNTLGSWGGGIALAFRDKYPAQFELYKARCKTYGSSLVGTCLLIPGDTHDIACLFTSRAYGKRKDKPEEILAATKTALQDLMKQNTEGKELHACRFNSGKFGVPWTDTEAILKELGTSMIVYTPAGEATSN
ncbi:putative macro domain containing protein [Lyophyllum shimeji]|uniref:ADP-ribose 1''-phosphate phosphatase n=1 Tax=Lyophyllum shimeji TaxID=47721 RepID=A0A9P3PMW7_LYOSH|nr:putative macro domain containing protein [Lyophyllum shimeji]